MLQCKPLVVLHFSSLTLSAGTSLTEIIDGPVQKNSRVINT